MKTGKINERYTNVTDTQKNTWSHNWRNTMKTEQQHFLSTITPSAGDVVVTHQ